MNQKQNKRKIVLTGGHAGTTALAVIEELLRRTGGKEWEIYFIGNKLAHEGKSIPTLESQAIPQKGVKFHPILAGKLQTRFTLWTVPAFIKTPIGFFQALYLLLKIRPQIILAFGGFTAFPVVFAGWLLGIPTVVHEQTSVYGRANKLSSVFAKKITLARKSSLKYFSKDKSIVVGNPILTQFASITPKHKIGNPPTIYITGGSRGSTSLNSLIGSLIRKLLKNYQIIHQTGQLDFDKFKTIRKRLSPALRDKYEVYSTIDPMQVDGVYKRADIIVARSGANTVSEIIAAKRPSLLIPLPIAFQNEQEKNALFAQKFGVAKVLRQKKLDPLVLLSEINKVKRSWNKIMSKIKDKNSPDLYSSQKLVEILNAQLIE